MTILPTRAKLRGMDTIAGLGVPLLGTLAAIVLLGKGADFFVDGAAQIARKFNISELVIGLTLVGFGTSAPEFAVSIGAVLTGRPDISVGNIIGSNTFNLGFILGGCAAVFPIATSRELVYRDGAFLIVVTLLLGFFLQDLHLARWEGATMMVLLVVYLGVLFRSRGGDADDTDEHEYVKFWGLKSFGGLLMILGGAHLLVESSSEVARVFGMSEWAIGVTIVAAGTSAPEVVTCLAAALKGRHGISAGALIGSDLYNLLGVLGLASFIAPMTVGESAGSSVVLLVGMVILAVVFMRSGWRIGRREGLALVSINLVRWGMDIGLVTW